MNARLKNAPIQISGDYSFVELTGLAATRNACELHRSVLFEEGYLSRTSATSTDPSTGETLQLGIFGRRGNSANSLAAGRWFGVLHRADLVACVRVLEFQESEVGRFTPLPDWLKHSAPCELNSLVVRSEHRKQKYVLLMMMRMAIDHAFQLSNVLCICAERPRLGHFYRKMGMHRTDVQFKYNETDNQQAELLYFDRLANDRYQTPLYKMSDRYLLQIIR